MSGAMPWPTNTPGKKCLEKLSIYTKMSSVGSFCRDNPCSPEDCFAGIVPASRLTAKQTMEVYQSALDDWLYGISVVYR